MSGVARWRVMAGVLILAAMLGFGVAFLPIYIHNFQLQSYVAEIAHQADAAGKPDDILRGQVIDEAHRLNLPVVDDNVLIVRSADSVRIDVRYMVPVSVPGYTVNLHFYPGAGSR